MIATIALLLALQAAPELKVHVDAGLKAKSAGDLDAAIREFQRVVELAPEMAAAHVNLGAVYYEKKDYSRAIPSLRKALELNPNLHGAHGMLGVALLALGFASESIPHLEEAKADDVLGVALLESGRAREAIDKLEAALEKQPDNPDLLYYLSQAHARLSKQAFDVLSERSPASARTHQMLGEARAASGNREAAEKEFRAALAMRPDLRGVHFALGEMYLGSGDYENAEREFRQEAHLAPGSAPAAFKLGVVLMNRGEVRSGLIDEIAHELPTGDLLFEAPQKSQQAWFIRHFGRDVNLGNIPSEEVISLETLRLGLRSDTLHDLHLSGARS